MRNARATTFLCVFPRFGGGRLGGKQWNGYEKGIERREPRERKPQTSTKDDSPNRSRGSSRHDAARTQHHLRVRVHNARRYKERAHTRRGTTKSHNNRDVGATRPIGTPSGSAQQRGPVATLEFLHSIPTAAVVFSQPIDLVWCEGVLVRVYVRLLRKRESSLRTPRVLTHLNQPGWCHGRQLQTDILLN